MCPRLHRVLSILFNLNQDYWDAKDVKDLPAGLNRILSIFFHPTHPNSSSEKHKNNSIYVKIIDLNR